MGSQLEATAGIVHRHEAEGGMDNVWAIRSYLTRLIKSTVGRGKE